MSLITRCPACETMFKVVPDQLRISEGWVRCGQCGEIFNASQHLLGPPAAPAEAAPAPTAPTQPPGTGWAQTSQPGAREGAPGTPAFFAQEPRWTDSPVAAEPAPVHAKAPVAPFAVQAENPEPPSVADPWTQARSTIPKPDVSFPSAGTSAKTFWRGRLTRMVLAVLAIGLAAALAAQVLFQERNRIAQIEPAARPALAALCALAGCELGPLKQIESIVIDSSSFGRLRADSYRLGFSLRNTAPIDVAMPSIELSLTDTQDQALVRRVIRPDEFAAPTPALAAGSDWSGALTLNVRLPGATDRIAGYRLLAFYP